MSKTLETKGRCLCGEIEIHAFSVALNVGACHCGTCRKWTGGPFFSIDCGTEVNISGGKTVSIYDSSQWAERGFCSKCGTHLFYKLKQNGQYFIPAGLFAEVSNLNFDHQVFIEEKPEYYSFSNETKNMTGEELFAQYSKQ